MIARIRSRASNPERPNVSAETFSYAGGDPRFTLPATRVARGARGITEPGNAEEEDSIAQEVQRVRHQLATSGIVQMGSLVTEANRPDLNASAYAFAMIREDGSVSLGSVNVLPDRRGNALGAVAAHAALRALRPERLYIDTHKVPNSTHKVAGFLLGGGYEVAKGVPIDVPMLELPPSCTVGELVDRIDQELSMPPYEWIDIHVNEGSL